MREMFVSRRLLLACASAVVLGGLASEVAARALHVGDFPVYDRLDGVSYILKPKQSGSFLSRYDYAVNSDRMGVAEEFPADGTGILLVGDSIVLGGNQIDQADRLGPLLADETGCNVWPLSAASWALTNQLNWLLANPRLLKVGMIVIVSNDSDFAGQSRWVNEYDQPTKRPVSSALYAVSKYFQLGATSSVTGTEPADIGSWLPQLAELRERFAGRIVFVGYPDTADVRRKHFDRFDIAKLPALLNAKSGGEVEYVELLANDGWTVEQYRDDIHPSSAGNHRLASLLAKPLRSCGADAVAAGTRHDSKSFQSNAESRPSA